MRKRDRDSWTKFNNWSLRDTIRERQHNLAGIGSWNTTGVTDMSELFFFADTINEPLHWDTSNVTTMRGMFRRCKAFNQPLAFDTSKVTDMAHMFQWARAFDQPLAFNTSKVTDMTSMFEGSSAFNQPIAFDTRRVEKARRMFYGATAFAQVVEFDGVSDTKDILTGSQGSMRPFGDKLMAADVPYADGDMNELVVPRRYTHGTDGKAFDGAVCPICRERAAVWGTQCGHIFCGECIAAWILQEEDKNMFTAHTEPKCPACNARFDPQQLTQVLYFGSTRRGFYMNKALAHIRAGSEAHYDRARHYARQADRIR
jgi:surface protein